MRDATQILCDVGQGSPTAEAELLPVVYQELRDLARRYLQQERLDHTLQPTALVHEAYLRLIDSTALAAGDRERFLALAAQAMRRVLVDHARQRKAAKRGGGLWKRVTLDDGALEHPHESLDVVILNDLLDRLTTMDPRMGQVVELRFFGGLSIDETARILGVSDRTVDNDWFVARAWLAREVGKAGGE